MTVPAAVMIADPSRGRPGGRRSPSLASVPNAQRPGCTPRPRAERSSQWRLEQPSPGRERPLVVPGWPWRQWETTFFHRGVRLRVHSTNTYCFLTTYEGLCLVFEILSRELYLGALPPWRLWLGWRENRNSPPCAQWSRPGRYRLLPTNENYRGPSLLGSGGGREGRAKVRSWVGADKWGAAGSGVSRGRRERALPRQARLAREQT